MATKLKIVPLGGLGEVGKNMMTIEYGRNILVVDVGVMFPESDMLGVDFILPDWDYLRSKRNLIRAILITHGHQDHIGGLPYFLREFNAPVYATRLTRGLIEVRLKEERSLPPVEIQTYNPGDVITIGPFTIEPYHVCHSIPDTVGLGITTPVGLVVHSGDFKFDHTPVDGQPTDIAKLAEFSGRGVLTLLSDSTNAEEPGTTPSESVLDNVFHHLMREAPGRLIIATFASLVSRIQQVIDAAARHDRRVAIAGRSMAENVRMARDLGYLRTPEGVMINLSEVKSLPPRQVLVLATGAQGEPMAVLNRLATGQHPSLQIGPGDTVVLSSHTIPGNEEITHAVINRLFQRGADVFYDPIAEVHVSGHASQEELKFMLKLLQPRFFVPIHGELRHLKQHGRLAREMGLKEENVAVVENGHPLTFDAEEVKIGKRVPGGYVFVDGSVVGGTGPAILREREALGQSGSVTAIVCYDVESGAPLGAPRILTRGFVFAPDATDLLDRAAGVVAAAASARPGTPATAVEKQIEQALAAFLYKETRRKPVIMVAVMTD